MAIEPRNQLPPKVIRITKSDPIFSDWRQEVANGAMHPIQMHIDEYIRLKIGEMRLDMSFNQLQAGEYVYGLDMAEDPDSPESQALQDFLRRPEVAWAVDISFDGLYITKDFDHAEMRSLFAFFVFLKKEQVTFWKLKFSGT